MVRVFFLVTPVPEMGESGAAAEAAAARHDIINIQLFLWTSSWP